MIQLISKKKVNVTCISKCYEGFIYVSDDKMPSSYDFIDYVDKGLNFGCKVEFYSIDIKKHIYHFRCIVYGY